MKDYNTLQSTIDKVVGKIGLGHTIELLETFIGNTSIKHSTPEKIKLLSHYIITLAIQHFDLSEQLFFVNAKQEYRDARMCCFYLLRKYTQDSYPKIGLAFRTSERTVEYGCAKVSERIEAPKGNAGFVARFIAIETGLLEFITKIN